MSAVALQLLVEFLGTLSLLFVIAKYGQPIPIALALAGLILIGSGVSGAHFNPAVTVMSYLSGQANLQQAVMYIAAQLAGVHGAMYLLKMSA